MGQGVDGLMEHGLQGLARALGQALAGDEQLGPAAGPQEIEGGAVARFGGVALAPVVGAEVAYVASRCKAAEDRPVPVTTTTLGSWGCGGGGWSRSVRGR
jgi:hypothetical protein